jgi:O-acetyl-ADP-ribose deacetylase (regulator of RNase III)
MIKDKIVLVQGDITETEVDAVVNAANTDLQLGAGVAGAIRKKGGPQLQAKAGGLKSRYVIHAAGMRLGGKVTQESLKNSTRNALLRAEEKGCKSIAFPAIGTGVGGYKLDACAKDMLRVVYDYLKTNAFRTGIEQVCFVLYDRHSFDTFTEAYERLPED